MRRLAFILLLTVCPLTLIAQSVSVKEARAVASNYLSINEKGLSFDSLPLRAELASPDGETMLYAFDIDTAGFIILSAKTWNDPVVGFSLGGRWDTGTLPPSLLSWLSSLAEDMQAVRDNGALPAKVTSHMTECAKEWKALQQNNAQYYSRKRGKNVEPLLSSQWDQSDGYNNFCPLYSNARFSNNGRAITGCVATAMAQIIRYHGYPNIGFGQRTYRHSTYGMLSAHFDSAYYDFSLMPDRVYYNTPQAQQDAVSLLCYHCGIAVKMDYENPNHTSGSGAHSHDVPEALNYFGYFGSFFYGKMAHLDVWDSLLRSDLDKGLPVYYSGTSNEGGHAFVCDGYRSNNQKYHFNFGWSGSGDGWYSLSTLHGYSSGQNAVFNIVPSHMAPYSDHYYVDNTTAGDGSSWQSAASNLNAIYQIFNIYNGGKLWMKKGVYLGDTSSDVAFSVTKNLTIYGGFAGTESSLDERVLDDSSATILSGGATRKILSAGSSISGCKIFDVTFANGFADEGSVVTINGGVTLERCSFADNNCTLSDGAALSSSSAQVLNCKFYNNNCGAVILNGIALKNSLVAHNNGFGILTEDATVIGCDIVCNNGIGIVNNGQTTIRNTVVWHNNRQIDNNDISRIKFCAIEGLGMQDSNSNFGLGHENRPLDGTGPFFILPDTNIGPSDILGDWHLSSLSPLVDAGDTTRSGNHTIDLDGGGRFRNGRADIGCYEWVPGNAIYNVDTQHLKLFPCPASDAITVEGAEGAITILDMMGKQVKHTDIHATPATIDISDLPGGIYLLRTASGSTVKFVKE